MCFGRVQEKVLVGIELHGGFAATELLSLRQWETSALLTHGNLSRCVHLSSGDDVSSQELRATPDLFDKRANSSPARNKRRQNIWK